MDSPPHPASVRPPPIIPEHQVLTRIGSGSFGEVWLARSRLDTLRAVKVIHRDRFASERDYERELNGLREFEPVSRTHPGLVDVLQVGQAEGWAYCVMELADDARSASESVISEPVISKSVSSEPVERSTGSATDSRITDLPITGSLTTGYSPRTLASDLRRGRLTAVECLTIGLALADALAHLHQRGLLHRDVKPSNIVFVGGVLKLADIGLVAAVSQAGSFVGTSGFIPPEGHLDARGDIFSLGKVLYECAWGRDRLEFPDVPTDAADWADHRPLMELNEVILKASDPHPARRYSSAAEMREELALLQHGKSLRRLRRLEKHRRLVTRCAVAAAIVTLLAIAGNLVQQRQSRRYQVLAEENRDRLVQLQVANGVRLMEEGDLPASSLWFNEALQGVAGNPAREWVHRRRLQALLERSPRLLAVGTHRGRIRAAQFSPDGRVFATAGADGTVRIWDALTGVATETELRHEAVVHGLQFSPDGRWLATVAEDHAARVWNAASGELRFAPLRHEGDVNSARFSQDGRRLVTASEDGAARIWDAGSGQAVGREFHHGAPVNSAELSPNGDLLATAGDDDAAQVWDVRTGVAIGSRLSHRQDVRSARFSPDGKGVVTASKDGTARVWNVATGRPATAPLEHSIPLWTAEFSPDGRTVLAAGGDGDHGGTARLWDARTGEPRTPPMRHGNTIRSAIFSPDGQWIATASHDRTVSLWNSGTGERVGGPFRHTHMMKWVSFSPDGKRLVIAGEDETWRLWDLSGALAHAAPRQEDFPFGIARFSPDGQTILGITTNQTAVLCEAATHRIRFILGEHPDKVAWAVFGADGRKVLTFCQDGAVRMWETGSGLSIGQPLQHGASASREGRAEFSPDGRWVASMTRDDDPVIKVWDLEANGRCVQELRHAYPAKTLAFSPNGEALLTGAGSREASAEGEVRLWSIRTGQLIREPMPLPGLGLSVHWSRDGNHFLTRSHDASLEPQSARIWETATGRSIVLSANKHRFTIAAFSPDGRFIAAGADDGEVRLWKVTEGTPATKSFGHRRTCWNLEFSPDGLQLASASLEPSVSLWDPFTGEPLHPPLEHGAPVGTISFSPGGDRLLVSGGGRATLWRLRAAGASTEELEALVQLASGCRLDETGGLEPLAWGKLVSLALRTPSR